MIIDSAECILALKEYPVKNDMEKLAIEVLLMPEDRMDEIVDLPGIPEMEDDEIIELARVIRVIRDNIGIED